MVAPTVRASTTQRARKSEVFDKMTTVRGFGDSGGRDLMDAIAATIQAGSEGRNALESISDRLQSREKVQHTKDMRRWKK